MWRVCFVSFLAVGCAPAVLAVTPVAAPIARASGSPVTRCEPVTHGAALGGVLDATFVNAVLGEVETAVAIGVCGCAPLLGHAAPGEVHVGVVVDPNLGHIEGGVRVSFAPTRWERGRLAGVRTNEVEACIARALDDVRLTERPLGTCMDPAGTGGRIASTVRVRVD